MKPTSPSSSLPFCFSGSYRVDRLALGAGFNGALAIGFVERFDVPVPLIVDDLIGRRDHLAGQPQVGTPERDWYEAIVLDWFSKPKAKKEVLQLLAKFSPR
jgi:hypothetical protein